jgi:hypothetical protein
MEFLRRDDVEVLLVGDRVNGNNRICAGCIPSREKKALVVIGHIPSEEEGMKECARWIKTLFPDADVSFIPRENLS